MPHCRPMMKTRPQITSVDERIRIPDWRSASPKKRKTRRPKTWARTFPQNLAISPKLVIQSRGTASHELPISGSPPCARSPDHRDLRMGGEQRLGEDVVE